MLAFLSISLVLGLGLSMGLSIEDDDSFDDNNGRTDELEVLDRPFNTPDIFGDGGANNEIGDAYDNTILGAEGDDTLQGSDGDDSFVIGLKSAPLTGLAIMTNFNVNDDVLTLVYLEDGDDDPDVRF